MAMIPYTGNQPVSDKAYARAVKLLADAQKTESRHHTLRTAMNNPVVELIACFVIIEWLQRQGMIGGLTGTFVEGTATGIIGLQQLAPLMPYLGEATGKFTGELLKVIPGLGMMA